MSTPSRLWKSLWTRRGPDADLAARVEQLERTLKSIVIEWDEWYDKYRRLYARLAKRVERAESDEQAEGKGNGTPSGLTPSQQAMLARMDPVSRAIWERRLKE